MEMCAKDSERIVKLVNILTLTKLYEDKDPREAIRVIKVYLTM